MLCFYGDDEWAAREELRAMAATSRARMRIVDKEDLRVKPLQQLIDEAGGGLFGKDLLTIENPMGLPKDLQEQVAVAAGQAPDFVVLWQRGSLDKRLAWVRALTKQKKVREFGQPSEGELVGWLQEQARALEGTIEPAAAQELVRRVGWSRERLLRELEKLLLETDEVKVSLVHERVEAGQVATEIFAMLDGLAAGNKPQVMRDVRGMLERGENEFYLLSMLAYQLRTLWLIRSGLDEGKRSAEIAKVAGLHPYVVEKNSRVAQRWSSKALLAAMAKLTATDLAIKQGKVDAKTALLMVVLGLAG